MEKINSNNLKGGKTKMTKPIGRIWINNNCISGYVVYGPMQTDIIKFACEKANNGAVLIYPSKKGKDLETEKEGD